MKFLTFREKLRYPSWTLFYNPNLIINNVEDGSTGDIIVWGKFFDRNFSIFCETLVHGTDESGNSFGVPYIKQSLVSSVFFGLNFLQNIKYICILNCDGPINLFEYVFYLFKAFSCLDKVNGKIVHFDHPNK